ncbi:Endonuclease/exonuclease/phosphatase [Suillus clintonianus]|uniref:Endonuclease/exonuclease/phosphatase n=1 Tax=Suillus clintonianus TaxID=1904413 RepID=UPI001B870CDD|nr:Endonuclease/exonuclease/phosphatase [Suillus clintonianus]KAG2140059.1 Endonuclease/exonuclease/phosphatase [Suillus clintonianus]
MTHLERSGRASPSLGTGQITKWTVINQMMREKKIGILCLQETHLTTEHETQIDSLFSRRLVVLNSKDPDRPSCSAGVAFVINKEMINVSSAKLTTIIPGRAIALSINWHNEKKIRILNVYAPNNLNEHAEFWNRISTLWTAKNLEHPDFVMGDFNLTEDPIDRAPARRENESATDALRDFRISLNVQDQWRHTFPNKRLFTFSSNTNTFSRLDRIYSSPAHIDSLSDWQANPCAVPTDHQLVLVKFAPPGLPHVGKGRWSWPLGIITDKTLIENITRIGIESQLTIEQCATHRTEQKNPQTEWEQFKEKITKTAKEIAKTQLAKINMRIKQLTKDLTMTTNSNDIDTSEDKRLHQIKMRTSKRKQHGR